MRFQCALRLPRVTKGTDNLMRTPDSAATAWIRRYHPTIDSNARLIGFLHPGGSSYKLSREAFLRKRLAATRGENGA